MSGNGVIKEEDNSEPIEDPNTSDFSTNDDTTAHEQQHDGTITATQAAVTAATATTVTTRPGFRGRPISYWVVLIMAVTFVVFSTGATFSCRTFTANGYDEVATSGNGYRGYFDSTTNDCISWDYHDGYYYRWYDRLQTLYYMGIGSVTLSIIVLAVWIISGYVDGGGGTSSTSRNWIMAFLTSPKTFGLVVGAFGTLLFLTLMGHCANIPPLDPGGLNCNFAAWSVLGMVASITACIMGCSLCCCYRR